MPFEYESLVGYLYVVGGRAISAPPPGALVEMSPRRAARERKADTVFMLVMPSGETVAPAAFYESMVRDGAAAYFDGAGSVTSGIRGVFTMLNERLFDHNQKDPRHYEASLICGVLRGGDLFIGKAGGGVILLQKDGTTQSFPPDLLDDDQIFTPPLGVQPMPDVRMTRYAVTAHTRLVFADAALAEYPMDTLSAALGAEDVGAVLALLREHVKRGMTMLAVEFVPPMIATTVPAKEGESSAAIMGGVAAAPAPAESASATPGGAGTISESPAPPPRPPRRSEAAKAVASGAAARSAKSVGVASSIFDRLVPAPKEGERSWLASPAAAGIAILLPVVLVVVVVLLWVGGTGESEFDHCVNRAQDAADTARTVADTDLTGVVSAWNAVIAVVEECDNMRSGDAGITALRTEARSVLDRLQNVTRRVQTAIYSFPNAQLTEVVLQGDDMYVLDANNQQVYRIALAEDGMSAVAGSYQPIPAMRRGGRVINFDVGDLVDIAWADNGAGLAASNVITALDKNGLLIACPPRFLQDCTAQSLLGSETWKNPKAIQYWEGRLYILDPEGNQIWRYDPSGGTFAGVPLEYFSGATRPDITRAVDFAITTTGDVYLLLDTGVVARFRSGDQQPFGFTFPDTQSLENPRAMFLNPNPTTQGLFFVEQDKRTIYETTMAGTFINAFKADDEDLYATLNNTVVDSNIGVIYALSGNTIFAFKR